MAQNVVYLFAADTNDARHRSQNSDYATAQSGSSINVDADETQDEMGQYYQSPTWYIYRLSVPIDTSALPDSATIASAILYLSNYAGLTGSAFDITITGYTGADPATTSDWGNFPNTSFGTLGTADWTAGYNAITLNASGIANISKTGKSFFAVRSGYDVSSTNTSGWVRVNLADGSYPPLLAATISSDDYAGPVVAGVSGGNSTSDGTSHTVSLPDNIADGDLVVVCFASDAASGGTTTFPEGWTVWKTLQDGTPSFIFTVAYKFATGDIDNFSVTTSANQQTAHTSYRISGVGSASDIAISTGATGATATPDPDNLTSGFGAVDTLWLAATGHDYNRTVTNYPAGFSNGRDDYANTTGGAGVGSAYMYTAAHASIDPTPFALSASDGWGAVTMAFRSAAAVNVSIAAPTATATAEGLVPTVASRVVAIIAAPTAAATAEGLIPTVTASAATPVDVQAVSATATAEGLLPTILAQRAAVITAVPPPNAAAVALVPTLTAIRNVVVAPAAATATAEGLLPTVTANSNAVIAPSPATASAEGLVPVLTVVRHASIAAPVASATAEGLVPQLVLAVNAVIDAPVAEASASGLVPTVTAVRIASIDAPTATASAEGLLPTVSTAKHATPEAPTATATAEGLVPTLTVIRNAIITAPTAEATGQGLVPTVLAENPAVIAAPTASATAEALAPTVTAAVCARVSPPAATATAAGLVPTVVIVRHARITATTATATAAGVVPTITAWRFIEAPTGVVVTSSAHTMATVTSAAPTIATITSTAHTAVTVTPPTTSATVTSKTPTKAVVKNG